MRSTGLLVLTLTLVPVAPSQVKMERQCGRVMSAGCTSPASPMTFYVATNTRRTFEVIVPASAREAFGSRVEERYANRDVCFNVRKEKGKAAIEGPPDLEITGVPAPDLSPLPAGIYELCDPGVHPPQVLKEVKPAFPPTAGVRRVDGRIGVRVIVRPDGVPGAVVVVDSMSPSMDKAAVAAVGAWRFKPATLDGAPVAVVVRLDFTFFTM